jgi:hypothetical protein
MKLIDTTPKPVEKTYTLEGLTEYDLAYIQYCLNFRARSFVSDKYKLLAVIEHVKLDNT